MPYSPLPLAKSITSLESMSESIGNIEGIDISSFETDDNHKMIKSIEYDLEMAKKDISYFQTDTIQNLYSLAETDLEIKINQYIKDVNTKTTDEKFPFSDWTNEYSTTIKKLNLKVSNITQIITKLNNHQLGLENLAWFWFCLGKNTNKNIVDYINELVKLPPLLDTNIETVLTSKNTTEFINNISNISNISNNKNEFKPTEFNFAHLTQELLFLDLIKIKSNKTWNKINNDELTRNNFFNYLGKNIGTKNNWSFVIDQSSHRVKKIKWDNIKKIIEVIDNDAVFEKLKSYIVSSLPYSTKQEDSNKINELNVFWNYIKLEKLITASGNTPKKFKI